MHKNIQKMRIIFNYSFFTKGKLLRASKRPNISPAHIC